MSQNGQTHRVNEGNLLTATGSTYLEILKIRSVYILNKIQ